MTSSLWMIGRFTYMVPHMVTLCLEEIYVCYMSRMFHPKPVNFLDANSEYMLIHKLHWLWLGDAIWHLRSWSTLIQVMAWCLMAPSHYLNQCWLTINKILWRSFQGDIYQNEYVNLEKSRSQSSCCVWNLKSQPSLSGDNLGLSLPLIGIWPFAGIMMLLPFNYFSWHWESWTFLMLMILNTFSPTYETTLFTLKKVSQYIKTYWDLTHCGPVMPYDIIYLGHHWLRWWLVSVKVKSQYHSWILRKYNYKTLTAKCLPFF